MIEISHTHEAGTLVEGTSKGDGTAAILKRAGFRWFPSLKVWGVAQSRDRMAKRWKIDGAAEQLRAAGFEVAVSVDDTPRDFALAESERAGRVEDRADRLSERAERAGAASTSAYEAARQELDIIPPGQPILVGHHSERGHRAALARIDGRMRASIEEGRKAEHYEQSAAVAGRYVERRESLGTTLRRIDKLEAEQRRVTRGMTACPVSGKRAKPGREGATIQCPVCYRDATVGDDLVVVEHGRNIGQQSGEVQLQKLAGELTYWRDVVAKQEASGRKVWGPDDFSKGDEVRDRWGKWRKVLRVNPKSLTVPTDYSWTDKIPYDDVHGQRRPDEQSS